MRVQTKLALGIATAGVLVAFFLLVVQYTDWIPRKEEKQEVLVRIGKECITVADFRQAVAWYGRSPEFQNRLLTLTPKGRRQILQEMVERRMFARAAQDDKLTLDPEVLAMLERLKRDKLAEQYIHQEVYTQPINQKEIQQYYQKHTSEFTLPEKLHLWHIVVADESTAETLRAQVQAGGDFTELAATYNIDSTKERKGDLGWISRGVMVKQFEDAAFKLKVGEISPVIRTPFGFHIIKLEERRPSTRVPFEQVEKQIRKEIREARLEQLKTKLEQRYPVKIDEHIWKTIATPE